ncbi:MAG: hypothetical protein AB1782_03330 [Cyanobacteriota bacterium]
MIEIKPKENKSPLVSIIIIISIVVYVIWILNNTTLHASLNCIRYHNNTGFCDLTHVTFLGPEKNHFDISEITGAESKIEKLLIDSRKNPPPDVFLYTNKGEIKAFINTRESGKQIESRINNFLAGKAGYSLRIDEDYSIFVILAFLLLGGILIYVFNKDIKNYLKNRIYGNQ